MQAADFASPRVRFQLQDLRHWRPETTCGRDHQQRHLAVDPRASGPAAALVSALSPQGWLAFQVPGNFDEPSHQLLRRLAADPRYAPMLTRSTGRLQPTLLPTWMILSLWAAR